MAGKTYDAALVKQGGLQVPAGGYMSAEIDCSVDNIGSSDVWQAFSLPAGTLIHEVGAVCKTAEGGTLTVDVGFTGGDVDGFLDGVNMNSAGAAYKSTAYESTQNAYDSGYYLSSADTIDFLFNNAADTAVIYAYVRYTKIA